MRTPLLALTAALSWLSLSFSVLAQETLPTPQVMANALHYNLGNVPLSAGPQALLAELKNGLDPIPNVALMQALSGSDQDYNALASYVASADTPESRQALAALETWRPLVARTAKSDFQAAARQLARTANLDLLKMSAAFDNADAGRADSNPIAVERVPTAANRAHLKPSLPTEKPPPAEMAARADAAAAELLALDPHDAGALKKVYDRIRRAYPVKLLAETSRETLARRMTDSSISFYDAKKKAEALLERLNASVRRKTFGSPVPLDSDETLEESQAKLQDDQDRLLQARANYLTQLSELQDETSYAREVLRRLQERAQSPEVPEERRKFIEEEVLQRLGTEVNDLRRLALFSEQTLQMVDRNIRDDEVLIEHLEKVRAVWPDARDVSRENRASVAVEIEAAHNLLVALNQMMLSDLYASRNWWQLAVTWSRGRRLRKQIRPALLQYVRDLEMIQGGAPMPVKNLRLAEIKLARDFAYSLDRIDEAIAASSRSPRR